MKIEMLTMVGIFWLNSLLADFAHATCRYTNENGGTLISTDQTVKDNVTGLIWQRAQAGTTMSQTAAISYCTSLSLNGFTFRLPTVRELSSLVNWGNFNPSIDPIAFPNTTANLFWSSTPYQPSPTSAWFVYFGSGGVGSNSVTSSYYVRCAR